MMLCKNCGHLAILHKKLKTKFFGLIKTTENIPCIGHKIEVVEEKEKELRL